MNLSGIGKNMHPIFKWLVPSILCVGIVTTQMAFAHWHNSKVKQSPYWKVGDCVQSQDFERFENPQPIILIQQVGKKKYLTRQKSFDKCFGCPSIDEDVVYFFASIEAEEYQKVSCPQDLTSPTK